MTGSVVFVDEVPPDQVEERIEVGDVITFSQSRDIEQTTTHRVVEKRTGELTDGVSFVTKGDNNDVKDGEPVTKGDVVGVVMFHIPVLGYVVTRADSTVGWALLVVVPFTLLLMDGMWQLYLATEPEENEE